MRVDREGPYAVYNGLSDFDWASIGTAIQTVAPAAAQLYAQKVQIDAQRKLAEAQARAQQQAALSAQYAQVYQPVAQQGAVMTQTGTNRSAGIRDGSNLPSWVMPAAIAGGVGLVALLLLRR